MLDYDVLNRGRLNLRDFYFKVNAHLNKIADNEKVLLCNSFPKSGTHLLSQILTELPGINYWDDIISVQALTGVMNTVEHINNKFMSAPSNSMVKSHLMYDEKILEILNKRNCKSYFIYRDPRDVVLSHANWVMKEPKIFLNSYYSNNLKTFNERVIASIKGIPLGTPIGSNVSLPSIVDDFARWEGWLSDEDTLAIKFEDLVGSRGGGSDAIRLKTIVNICNHAGYSFTDSEVSQMFPTHKFDPEKSHTFKKGQKGAIGGWKDKFTPEIKECFKDTAGQLLIDLGYEQDFDW